MYEGVGHTGRMEKWSQEERRQEDQKPGEPEGRSNQSRGLKMDRMGRQAVPETGRQGPGRGAGDIFATG